MAAKAFKRVRVRPTPAKTPAKNLRRAKSQPKAPPIRIEIPPAKSFQRAKAQPKAPPAKALRRAKAQPARPPEPKLRPVTAAAARDLLRSTKADTGDVMKGAVRIRGEGKGRAVSLSEKVADTKVLPPQFKAATMLPFVGDLHERFFKDVVNLPAQAVPSVYVPVAGVAEAAQGRPRRLQEFKGMVQEHDPVYAAGEAVVKTVKGDLKGAKKAAKRSIEKANEHPGFAAAEVYGLKGTVGRGVTRGQELTGRRPTRRAPATLPGTDLTQPRAYSRDAFTRAGQKFTERNRTQRADRARTEAVALERADPARHADRIDELRAQANRVDPTRMRPTEVRKRASERTAANETIRRENRAIVGQEVRRAVSNTRMPEGSPRARAAIIRANRQSKTKPTAATTLTIQNITDATIPDLVAYKAEIAREYPTLSNTGRKANRQLQKEIQEAIDRAPDPVALREAATAYARIQQPRTQQLVDRGMLPAESAVKAPLVPYAVRKMGATVTEKGPVDSRGVPITVPQIRAHMRARGVPEPSYVSQAPRRGGAFFVSSTRPQSVPRVTRTGGATQRGTFTAHPDVLAETAARTQGLVDAADGFTSTIKEFAHKPTLGKLKTYKDADAAAQELSATTGVEYRPVRINPFAGRQEQLQALLDTAGEGPGQPGLGGRAPVRDAVQSAWRGEDGPGPWALIPRHAADEFAQHAQQLGVGTTSKVIQLGSQAFRKTVLATSPTWMVGNLVESGLRSALSRSGPRSHSFGKAVLAEVDRLDPLLGRELRARAVGGGHFASADYLHVRRGAEQFEGSKLEPLANALHTFWETPGPKQAAQAWNLWTDLVFRQLNGRLESQFQTAILGRALRDSPLLDPSTPRWSRQAVEQAARGLTNTSEQAALARAVEHAYGKYNGFNAGTRWAIATYTPFIAWTLNAVKFVADVLPRDHPAALAAIAAAENATDEWRKTRGMDLFIKEGLPGFLQGSIPTKGGGHQRAPFRYTPFGAFGDPLATAGGAVLPQAQGVLSAFRGQDWKGAKLRKENGDPADTFDKAKAAATAFTDATVPLLGLIKRVSEGGPGKLNPLAPVRPPEKKAKAKAKPRTADDLLRGGGGGGHAQSQADALIGGGGNYVDQQIDKLLSP
jgi:hypothetical protein